MKIQVSLYTVLFFILYYSMASYAQAPDWLWAKRAGGLNNDVAYSIAVDNSGNTYVAGDFKSSTITFGSTVLTSAGGYDIFLVKYDANGNVLWAKRAGGTSEDRTPSVAVDAFGNAYLAGSFSSPTITIGATILTNAGSTPYFDLFLAKYDANGNVIWAKRAGGMDNDMANSVAVDITGNIYVAGVFSSSNITFGINNLNNVFSGVSDIFVAKYNASGTVLWAKSGGGINADWATSVTADINGNVFVTGYFYSHTLNFGSTTLTNSGTTSYHDLFLVKYDANGNVHWAKSAAGTYYDVAKSVTVDTLGNTYITGSFNSPTLNFGPTTLTNDSVWFGDIFIAKYDTNGTLLMAKRAGGKGNESANSINVDHSGYIYVAGSFGSSTLIFDSTTLTNAGSGDIFLAKYDINGNVLWARSVNGTGDETVYSITGDHSGNTYIAGSFESSTLNFSSNTLTNADNTGNTSDMYVAKLAAYTVAITKTNVNCYGGNTGTATAHAIGGGVAPLTYLWNTIPAQTTQTAVGLTAGGYIVTITDANNASYSASITITQPSAIIVSTSGDTAICKGSNTTICIYASGGVSPYQFLWSNNSTSACQTVSPDSTTNYSATVTDFNNCLITSTVLSIIVNPLVFLGNFNSTCINEAPFVLSGGSPIGGSYFGAGVIGGNFNPASAGLGAHIITYTFTDGNGCTDTDSNIITVNALPTVTLGGFSSVCIDAAPLYLTGGSPAGGSYSGTGVSGGTFIPATAGQGIYMIKYTYTDGNYCTNADSNSITVNELPSVSITGLGTLYCIDNSPIPVNGTPAGGTINGNGIVGGNFNPSVAGVGTWQIIYFYTDGNLCANSDTVWVTVSPCTGIDEAENSFVKLYPNPANDRIVFENTALSKNMIISIFSLQGQLLFERNIISAKTELDIRNFANGVYFVKFQSADVSVVKKFVKE